VISEGRTSEARDIEDASVEEVGLLMGGIGGDDVGSAAHG